MELHYNDIVLEPNLCVVNSRSECDTSIEIGNNKFDIPVIPANMKCTIDMDLAYNISQNNNFYILHRFYNYQEIFNFCKKNRNTIPTSISVGVKSADYKLIDVFTEAKITPDYITIDIAHGHSLSCKAMIMYIRNRLPDTFIIAGNIGSATAVIDLVNWGANGIKVGIACGAVCITKDKTGFSSPMFSLIQYCRDVINCIGKDILLIADGGIRCNGDIAKAIVAGADMVMIGSMFAKCIDSPAESVYDGELLKSARWQMEKDKCITHKKYFGSASEINKGHNDHIEGREVILDCNKMYYNDLYKDIKQSLQSSISYAGGKNLSDLKQCNWKSLK